MGILDQIRNTTVADLDKVTGDFSDLPASIYRPHVERAMVRIVEGADDLRPAVQVPNINAGMVRTDGSGTIDTRPFKGQPTEPQRNYMNSLMEALERLDRDAWHLGMEYMQKMDEAGAWNSAKGENASRWIDRLKAKIAEAKVRPVPVIEESKTNAWAEWRDVASRLAAIGGRFGTRFAVETEKGAVNELAFWWIAPGREGRYYLRQIIGGQGAVRVRMTPEAMVGVAKKIIAAGPIEAMTRYGLELGECGHCGRELTNDESRAVGMGPKCRKGKGEWH